MFHKSDLDADIMSFEGPSVPGSNLSFRKKDCENNVKQQLSIAQEVQVFIKHLLMNRLFLGHYQERRLVEPLKSYRDVVVVSSIEKDLKRDLEIVCKKLNECSDFSGVWIGITGPDLVGAPAGHALWVKLSDVAFGQYWFQIKQVKLVEGKEFYLRLKCIRPLQRTSFSDRGDFESPRTRFPDNVSETIPETSTYSEPSVSWDEVKGKLKANMTDGAANLVSLMTFDNAKGIMVFLVVLITACVTGLFQSLHYLGDYSLRFMREFSYIIHATTPIFLAVIDFFSKVVGGFYLLVSMMWRSYFQPELPPVQFHRSTNRPRAIEMPRNWQRR